MSINNKRITITSDLTPIQILRRESMGLMNELVAVEGKLEKSSELTIGKIRHQINLIKERNELLSNTNLNIKGGDNIKSLKGTTRGIIKDLSELESKMNKIYSDGAFNLEYQIELIKERNELFISGVSGGGAGMSSGATAPPIPPPPKPDKSSSGGGSGGGSGRKNNYGKVLGSILSSTTTSASNSAKSSSTLELILREITSLNGHLSGSNGVSGGGFENPRRDERHIRGTRDPKESSIFDIFGKGGFSKFSGMGSIMKAIPYAGAIMAVGAMIGKQRQFQSQQYAAENSQQRENNIGNHWLLNTMSFGVTGAMASESEIRRNASKRNDEQLRRQSALHGASYEASQKRQLSNSLDRNKMSDYKTGNFIHTHPVSGRVDTVNQAGINIVHQGGNGRFMGPETLKHEIKTRYADEDAYEIKTDHSRIFGLNTKDYLGKVTDFEIAGARPQNTRLSEIDQLLVASRTRGVTDSDITSTLKSTRFSDDSLSASKVMLSLDLTLQKLGKSDQEISSTISEYLQQFNRMSGHILDYTGKIKTENVVSSLTSIQKATGASGKQLERYQDAFMGKNIAKDDVTQALLMRTARSLDPKGSVFDLQAMMENMPNDPKLQKKFFKEVLDRSGDLSNSRNKETLKWSLNQVFPGLSKMDISEFVEKKASGKNVSYELFNSGTSIKNAKYDPAAAAATVSESERSIAATEDKHIINGMLEADGKTLTQKMNHREDPIPVVLIKDETEEKIFRENSVKISDLQALMQKYFEPLGTVKKKNNAPLIFTTE